MIASCKRRALAHARQLTLVIDAFSMHRASCLVLVPNHNFPRGERRYIVKSKLACAAVLMAIAASAAADSNVSWFEYDIFQHGQVYGNQNSYIGNAGVADFTFTFPDGIVNTQHSWTAESSGIGLQESGALLQGNGSFRHNGCLIGCD